MNEFQELECTELELVDGGVLWGVVIVGGVIAVGAAFAYGYSKGSEDCPLTPK